MTYTHTISANSCSHAIGVPQPELLTPAAILLNIRPSAGD